MDQSHVSRVAAVASQLAARTPGSTITIRKNSPSHSVRDAGYKRACHPVDVSPLTEVLSIDPERCLARVEGQVTMEQLSRATLAYGLLPAVVPEFRRFTVAGLINGEGIQSSSHRYGAFTHNVESIEILIADGSVIEASATSNVDVFSVLPESLGTLGIVTAATIRLVPAERHVKLTYRAFSTRAEYLHAFRKTIGSCAFHEGVIYGRRLHVLITGDFVDVSNTAVTLDPHTQGAPYFYDHVRNAVTAEGRAEDVLDTLSYLSRSERGYWWVLAGAADFPLLSETTWGRRFMDKSVTKSYERAGFGAAERRPGYESFDINQDMGIKLERLDEGIAWVTERIGVYPIWNCALRVPDHMQEERGTEYYVDIGLYGEPMAKGYETVRDLRALQQFVDLPSLWGVSYLTWQELRKTNPQRFATYDVVRQNLNADSAFLALNDKVVWVDPNKPGMRKPRLWRLRRSFGPRWFLNPLVYLVLTAVYVSKQIWKRPSYE